MRSLLSDVAALSKSGDVQPLLLESFPARDAAGAFRLLASAKHMGKVVIDYSDLDDLKASPLPRPQPQVSDGKTYLITGGLSGFGWATAEWLIEKGARNLVLLGRRTPEETGVSEQLAIQRAAGVHIHTIQVDVSHEEAMQDVFEEIAFTSNLPPIRGIFHCAGILDDALVQNLNEERIGRVLEAKAQGAIILDRLVQGMDLDYFVLFSSVTTVLGNVGQSAYIAANAVLGAVAANRWKDGEAARG